MAQAEDDTNPTGQPEVSASTDQQTTSSGKPGPNRRRKNPLGEYSSYTYRASLYMITPDAYDEFISRNRTGIEQLTRDGEGRGAYLIAQSGGINNDVISRAPGFLYDYYIDNIKLKSAISPQATGTSSATFECSFDIIEPYGFSFITNLKRASNAMVQYSNTKNIKNVKNPIRQFFVIGIKFLGYDGSGEVIKETEGMFERFFDIIITDIKFKIDGRVVTYNISAASLPIQASYGLKRGMLNKDAALKGNTVRDVLLGQSPESGAYGLISKLNEIEEANKDIEEKNRYNIVFAPGAEEIANATIVDKADLDKSKFDMGNVKSTADVNPNLEIKAVPNVNSKQISFKSATPILQAIQQIVAQSSYLKDALKYVYTSELQADPKTDSPDVIKPNTKKRVKWYNISTQVSNARWDTKRSDFAFDITYVISPYETPIIVSTVANNTTPYYGPIKRYDYWYTGQNSEILRYEQSVNNAYFNVVLKPDKSSVSQGGNANISKAVDQRKDVARLSFMNIEGEAQLEYITQLIDPGNYADAKIEIIGDPDWLIQASPGDIPSIENPTVDYNPFYGTDGYTVNPNVGQVFIEIDFKEAKDYNTDTGLMTINDKILLWDYPPEVKDKGDGNGVKGISYRVNTVTSFFRQGKFTQELWATINTFGFNSSSTENPRDPSDKVYSEALYDTGRRMNANTTATNSSDSTSQNNGFKQAPTAVVDEESSVAPTDTETNVNYNSTNDQQTTTTKNGLVADDDATSKVAVNQYYSEGRENV